MQHLEFWSRKRSGLIWLQLQEMPWLSLVSYFCHDTIWASTLLYEMTFHMRLVLLYEENVMWTGAYACDFTWSNSGNVISTKLHLIIICMIMWMGPSTSIIMTSAYSFFFCTLIFTVVDILLWKHEIECIEYWQAVYRPNYYIRDMQGILFSNLEVSIPKMVTNHVVAWN